MLCLEGAEVNVIFVNHVMVSPPGQTYSRERPESHGYHGVNTTNDVPRRCYELEIGEGEMVVVGKFCWTWRRRRYSYFSKRTGYCQPESVVVVLL